MSDNSLDKADMDLTKKQLLLFSLPAIPLAIMLVPLIALVPIFYSKYVGLSLTTVGVTLMVVRLLDVVTDPTIALLSDRSTSLHGRRRPWLIIGTPILLVGLYFLLNPVVSGSALYLFASATIAYLGWTFIQIPYYAWGADLVRNYKQRTQFSGFREGAMIVGIAVVSLVPMYASTKGHDIDHYTMQLLFVLAAVLLVPSIAAVTLKIKDPLPEKTTVAEKVGLSDLNCFQKPFLRLLLAFVSIGFGKGIGVSVTAYFVIYGLGMPEVVGPTLFLPYLCIMISIPVWMKVAGAIGRHKAVTLSLSLASLILIFGVWPLEYGDGWLFVAVECLVGLAAGAFAIFPTAIVADVSDYHTLKTKKKQAALHFSVWSMAQKAVQAVAVGLALPLISFLGFDPATAAENDTSLLILKATFIGLPVIFYILGAAILWRFPITEKRHLIIQKRLERTSTNASNPIGKTYEV